MLRICPNASTARSPTADVAYHLGTRDGAVVSRVLQLLEIEGRSELGVKTYDIVGPTLEDVFLTLMRREEEPQQQLPPDVEKTSPAAAEKAAITPAAIEESIESSVPSLAASFTARATRTPLSLTDGRDTSVLRQALVIVYKRFLILRRSWLTPLLAILIAICGSCVPLFFLRNEAQQCGALEVQDTNSSTFRSVNLWLPESNEGFGTIYTPAIVAPKTLATELGKPFQPVVFKELSDNTTFVQAINGNFQNISFGGLSVADNTVGAQVTLAWEATDGTSAATLNNFASNIIFNRALSANGQTAQRWIKAEYAPFTSIGGGPLNSLKWMAFFAAAFVRYFYNPYIY